MYVWWLSNSISKFKKKEKVQRISQKTFFFSSVFGVCTITNCLTVQQTTQIVKAFNRLRTKHTTRK